jgi:hypothetical protein
VFPKEKAEILSPPQLVNRLKAHPIGFAISLKGIPFASHISTDLFLFYEALSSWAQD